VLRLGFGSGVDELAGDIGFEELIVGVDDDEVVVGEAEGDGSRRD
jgi:hypothetical protein